MEAKDTVIGDERILEILKATTKRGSILDIHKGEHRNLVKAQAEISFAAGIEHGLVIAKKNYLLGKGHGIREVVEKLKKKDRYMETDKSMLLLDAEYIKVTMRELKEWGIK